MGASSKLDRFDKRVRGFLDTHFKNDDWSHHELTSLWATYHGLGLPNEDFVSEFTNGKPAALAQRTWELQLAQHLHDQGHKLTCVGNGPDLRFEHEGITIWVEAVCPEARGLPAEWLSKESGMVPVPHEQILLRWMTAFDAKVEKLRHYFAKGTVKPDEAYIIAINGCQLGSMRDATGITRIPLGAEAVFPAGRLQYHFDPDSMKFLQASIGERHEIVNHNETPIPTTSFLEPEYAGVSAVLGSAADRRYGKPLPIHVVHNPRATVPAPVHVYGAGKEEWRATPVPGEEGSYDLEQF